LPQSLLLDDLNKAMNSFLESRPNSAWDGSSDPSLERDRSLSSDVLYFAKTYKNHLLASLLLIVGVAIAVVTVGALRDNVPDAETARSMRVTSLTTSGKVVGAAISPDGARLIYAVDEGEQQSLFLKEMKGVGETRLASSRLTEYRDLSFSPDGRWVSYFKSPAEDGVARPAGAAFQIPAYGGPEQPSPIQNAISAGSFAPDGKSLAGARATAGGSETSVWVGDESGNGVDLLTRRSPAAVQPIPPVWSPDGRLLVCATREADNDFFLKLVAVNVKTKAEQTLVSGRWAEIDRVTWRADGTGLVVAAGDPITRKSQLWRVDYPSGIVSRITQDGSDYRGVSLTRDASILISVQSEALSNVWIAPALGAEHPRQISTGRLDGLNGLSWAPDGRLAYVSWANDREGVWVVGPGFDDPQHQQAPTESGDRVQYQPAVSPDGRRMAYVSERDGGAYLYVGALDHRESVAVSKDRLSFFPQFSSDGGSVIYSAMRNGRGVIARVPSEGGSPETLVAGRAWRAVVSPDGTKLACNYLDESVARWRIAILPVTGGAPVAVYDAPGSMNRVVQWTPDGSGVAFIVTRGGVSNLWSQPLSGGPANRFTDFKTNRIFNFAWSRDGRTLALAHGWTTSDVAIIQNFR
jgi:Tol biopolymer transport system component